MSNYLRNNDDANRETTSPIRRRRLWLATGVVGLTGAVSLAGVAYATTGATGAHRLTDLKWSTAQQLTKDDGKDRDEHGEDRDERGEDRDERGKDRDERGEDRDEHGRVREVPCDDEKLIEAVDLANRDQGGTLKLAPRCTYELSFSDKKSGTGLPTIKQEITIKGNDATIKRDSEDAFRLFRVADGGDLTLKDLTLKDGNAAEFKYGGSQGPGGPAAPQGQAAPQVQAAPQGPQAADAPQAAPAMPTPPKKKDGEADGGALLVERGGSAHLEKTTLTRNNAEGNGGAIANFGRVDLEDSKVENNHAQENGGGIFNVGVLKVKESRITNNTAGENGGGIANGHGKDKDKEHGKDKDKGYWPGIEGRDEAGSVEIFKTSIEGNTADDNGGGVFSSSGFVKIVLSSIKENTACESGGGIYARNTNLDLEKVTVAKNHASKDGGGIVNTGGEKKKEAPSYGGDKKEQEEQEATATIADSEIVENTAGRFGGGIFNGDPDVELKDGYQDKPEGEGDNATLTLRDTEIKGNTALNGGGIFNNKGTVTLTKTHVTKNTATDSSKLHRVAGGILNNDGKVRLDEKSTVTNNDPTNCAGTVKDCFN
ncbi:hypothetical protein [Micromonospora sp. NPDC050200]|uniref:hypothetical protein n=1 Tax=Micromonospora sp. NPDC050200 TaxID=3155664 RepID=UPI00340BC4F2